MAVICLLLARGRDRLETDISNRLLLQDFNLLLARGRDRLETRLIAIGLGA